MAVSQAKDASGSNTGVGGFLYPASCAKKGKRVCSSSSRFIIVILGFYYLAFTPFVIEQPVGAFMMFVLAWFSGCAIGLVIYALKPWAPDMVILVQTVFQRLNMVASGKMFVANSLPGSVLVMFTWNPLFHVIDQARGFAFINYQPRNSDLFYPLYFSLGLLMFGFIGEYYTRQRASSSWLAKI